MVLNIIALMNIKNKEHTLHILTSIMDNFIVNPSTSALAFKSRYKYSQRVEILSNDIPINENEVLAFLPCRYIFA